MLLKNTKSWLKQTQKSLRVAFFLAVRQIKRGTLWVNVLIVAVMVFTLLNLIVATGILVGIPTGAVEGLEDHYTGDILISTLDNRSYIQNSNFVLNTVSSTSAVKSFSSRYLESGTLDEERVEIKKPSEKRDTASAVMVGINPDEENKVTDLKSLLIKGSYLDENDTDEVLIGALLLKQYAGFESDAFSVLKGIDVGSDIVIEVGGHTREVTVKGILRSKVDEVDRRVFFNGNYFRGMIGRFDRNIDEVALQLSKGASPKKVKKDLMASGVGEYAEIQTREEAEPKILKDLKTTFSILGTIVSSTGLVAASITIFIVIFISAITRRKFIGILKGIGIESRSIEIAYVLQALFYAFVGTGIGLALIFFGLKPYITANPIDFPFADGLLVTTFWGTTIRVLILFLATFIAGYLPARIIVQQNTLDAILER